MKSWRNHVNLSISKAVSNFLNFSRYKRFLDKPSKIILCESLVLSQFNYCNVVLSNMDKYLEQKIQKIQHMCIRFIFDIRRKDHCDYNAFIKELGWLDMKHRSIKHGLTLIF